MALGNVEILERAQCKIEAVRGTAETTMTRWLYFPPQKFTWQYLQDLEAVSEVTRSYVATIDRQLGIRTVRMSVELNLTNEEAVWWLNAAVDGSNLTGTTTGSTPAGFTYSLAPNVAADDLASFTLKGGDTTNIYKFSRCMVNKATFRWNPQQGGDVCWRMVAEIWAIFVGTTTYDAPADITRTKILARGTKVYIDTTTIGTTQLLATVRQGEFTIDNQMEEKIFSESVLDPYTDVGRGEQIFTGSLVMENNAAAEAEFVLMRAGTVRKLRFSQTGAQIGITPTTNYLWQVDFPNAKWMAPVKSYAGHNSIITFPFVGQWTAAAPQPLLISDVTAAAAVAA